MNLALVCHMGQLAACKESTEGHEEGEIHKGGCFTLAKAPGVVVEAGVCAPPCCAHLADDCGVHPLQVHQSVVLA